MEQRLSLVTLGVADLSRAKEFYVSREDVDRLLAKAEAVGGRILRGAQEASWGGYTGYFADPDGHVWEVAFNPYAVIGEDGSFRISEDD